MLRATDAPEHVARQLRRPLLLHTDDSLLSLCTWQPPLWRGSKLLGVPFPAVIFTGFVSKQTPLVIFSI